MDAPASTNNPGNQKPSCHFPLSSPYSRMPHRPATNSPHCMTGYAMDKPTCGSAVAMMEHMLPRFQQVPEAMPGRAASLGCREGQGPCCTITRMAVTIGAAISTPAKHKHLLQQQKQHRSTTKRGCYDADLALDILYSQDWPQSVSSDA